MRATPVHVIVFKYSRLAGNGLGYGAHPTALLNMAQGPS